MPIYEYQCDSCGLRKEKLWRTMSSAKDSIDCESCGEPMRKQVTAANFAFSHPASQKRGALPPNTGTSDDWNFDKAIGDSADASRKVIEKRDKVKDAHIQQERKEGRLVNRDQLVRASDGGYRTITEKERTRVNQNRKTAVDIAKAASSKKGSKDPG